jgi:anti-sigma factor RsiW
MNCHDARDRLSDFLDEALGPPELAEVRAHVEGCPECRGELERLRATVSLLARVERPRAPLGFVDRVMAAARPVPWYRRFGRLLFLPLGIKLPAEAAAMVMIAVLGVFLLQRTPEMKEAARPEFQSPASRSEAPPERNAEPAPAREPAQSDLKAGKADFGKRAEQAPRVGREAENTMRDERRLDSPPSPPPASEEPKQELNKERDADRFRKAGAPSSQAAPAPPAAAQGAVVPAAPPAESGAKSRDSAEGQSRALAPARPEVSAKRQSAMSAVFGRLNVKDRPSAEKSLTDLLTRLGGSEIGRRQELGATVVEVLVPEARYTEFVRSLTALGAWTAEGQPTALPTDPPQLRFSIRISE